MHISIDQSKHNLIVSHIFLALFRFKICDCVVARVFSKDAVVGDRERYFNSLKESLQVQVLRSSSGSK